MKTVLKPVIVSLFLIIIAVPAYADSTHPKGIKLDGTLGSAGKLELPGPDYDIKAEHGQQAGSKLFHSFQQFNLHKGESATFTGPDSVKNIVSRVTGGEVSWIDGRLASAIPGADLYFMNPAGLMFGPNASLDLQGSFHATSADWLGLGENGRFHARNPEDSIMSVAPVESFGFLTDSPAPIEVTDSHLEVPPTKTLSLTGGNLILLNSRAPIYDEASQPEFAHQLLAPAGRIVLDAEGALGLKNFGIATGGPFGGRIDIRANSLEMDDSQISSHTFGDQDGQSIDIRTASLSMRDSDIIANTYGPGRGSDIRLQVDENLMAKRSDRPIGVEFGTALRGSSHISTLTAGPGDIGPGGDIHIRAGNIDLREAAEIRAHSFSQSKSGHISLQVGDTFRAEGVIPLNPSTPDPLPLIGGVHACGFANGDSGDIDIVARNIMLDKGGEINASTIDADGGFVSVRADIIRLSNQGEPVGIPTGIISLTIGSGEAGRIDVEARQVTLVNGGTISTTTALSGKANELNVRVSDTLTISGVAEGSYQILGLPEIPYPSNISSASTDMGAEGGQASNVHVAARHIVLENGGTIASLTYGGGDAGDAEVIAETIDISGWQNNGLLYRSGINNSSSSPEAYAGQARNMEVSAKKIRIDDGGAINASAANAGGGNISIHAEDMIHLSDQGDITSSVRSGVGDGGNIGIENPQFTVLKTGRIIAQADAGEGGNIRLSTGQLVSSSDSLVSASSRLGIDGDIRIEAPDVDLSGNLTISPGTFADAARWMKTPCSERAGEKTAVL